MNVERFIEARRQKGLSQSELAADICTQATLSRFENNAQVPNLKILIKLCERLDLPLGELFPKVGIKYTDVIETLNQAEFLLITSEYEQSKQLIETIDISLIEECDIVLRYRYLTGFLMVFQHDSITEILFNFDQILLDNQEETSMIYHLLAYTGIGMVFAREKEEEKAEFYFNKVLEKIYYYPIKSVEDTWRVLNILYQCGEFYASIGEIEASNVLLRYAITICSDNHVTYYLARAAAQLAQNAVEEKQPIDEILELIYDARAYAKINRNEIKLKELNELEQTIKNGL
ncbi:helix-turn-helix domain-containing protein [Vagococcus bubulae]|uniref:Transcriptional regulator n=1 Tax=Vagococcus bubulae TaxID=1977868 RepID=A0A429ZQ99_9ENTE|nr:helix-turn-helix transcriptional regulator [Vagococcus bubulae]RST95856.1 transcriptional regulator [Vagococcus bubulae]